MKKVRNLYKAQMGGGTEQDETYKQLATAVYGAIKRGQSPEDVYQSLITNKINKDVALKIVSGIVEYMVSNGELEEEDLQRQSQEKQQEQQQRMQEQQAFSQPDSITDEWNENSAQSNNYDQEMQDANQQSMDLVNEDAEDTDENVEPSEVVDYSKLISSTPGTQNVQFPGIEEYYLPYNPLFSGDFQLNYQEPSSNESEESDQMQYAKYGGSRVKRKFTNQVLKLLKKQAGGQGEPQEDEVVNSGKASQTDDLTGSVKKVKDSFINAVSGQAKKVAVGNWFEKLKQNNDPMLDQILNPPSKENPLERKMQEDKQIQQELSPNQMKKGGSNRAYKRLAKKIYNQMVSQVPIPKGFNVPISYYDKRAPFVNQRFSTIGVPQINRYFELLAQMYPKPKSANEQADDAVIKNNMVNTGIDANPFWAQPNNFNLPQNPFMQEGGDTGIDRNPLWSQLNNFNVPQNPYNSSPSFKEKSRKNGELYSSALNEYNYFLQHPDMWNEDPEMLNEDGSLNLCLDCINVDYTNREHVEDAARLINEGYTTGTHRNEKVFRDALNQFGIAEPKYKSAQVEKKQYGGYMQMPGQYGGATGSNDPSIAALTRFIYGGDDQFPEESKNVNDPYFSDMTPYPQMQEGGDPSEYTHYTHGDEDIFDDQMNELVQAEDGINVNNPYLEQLQQLLQQSNYSPRDIRRAMRDQRRMTGNTYRDLLFPANRAIQYSGSWAQQMGLPFTASDGQIYLGDVNGPLAKREVTKRGILGRPKEWTDYYMQGADGNNQDLITLGTNNQDNQDNQNTSKKKPIDRLDRKIQRWDERSNRGIPAETDAYQFTGTLTGSPITPAKEPMSNEEMLKSQGKMWDENQKKWVLNPVNDPNATRTPGISPSQGANLVTGTPGISVGTLPYKKEGGSSEQKIILAPKEGGCPDGEYWTGTECKPIPKNTKIVYSQEELDKLNLTKKEQQRLYNEYITRLNNKYKWNQARSKQYPQYAQSNIKSLGNYYKTFESIPRHGWDPLMSWGPSTLKPPNGSNNMPWIDETQLRFSDWKKRYLDKSLVKPIGYWGHPGGGHFFPVYEKPSNYLLGYNREDKKVEEIKLPPIPPIKHIDQNPPALIQRPPFEFQQFEAPEYVMPDYTADRLSVDVRLPKNKLKRFITGDRGILTTPGNFDIGKREKTRLIPKIVQKVTGYDPEYMETSYDDEGNPIYGEMDYKNILGEDIEFKGASSLRDLKAQKEYRDARAFYEKQLEDQRQKYAEWQKQPYKKGGILRKALLGNETPVSYTGNPVFQGQSEVDWTANTAGSTNLQPSSFWQQSTNNTVLPTAPQQMQDQNAELTKYNVDPNQIEEYQAPKQFRGLVGVKRKRKDMTTVDPEAGVNTFNAGVRGALGAIDNMRSKKQEAQMYAKNFDPTQIYGKKERIDKGDWDVNTGMYRTNETGANRLGRSKKYGGYMQDGGESDNMFYPQDNMIYPPGDSQYIMRPVNLDIMEMLYNKYYSDPNFMPYNEDPYIEEYPEGMDMRMVKEGGETYMSDEQINAFLAAGGQIEYL